MTAKITCLFKNGRNLHRAGKPAYGDLNLSVSKHPVSGRCTHEANLLGDNGEILPALYDATCISISRDGFRLRGIEIITGREVAQEWWVIPIPGKSDHITT